jgi:uncharacterized repeat protein (TIGR01451 family)
MNNHKVRIISTTIAVAVMALMSISIARADDPPPPAPDALPASPLASETLEQYAAKCDLATGVTVTDFSCDAGTEVPISHFASGSCDRPNRLNRQCDPGSHFQVLANTPDATVVAHCRKEGHAPGEYGDIAVIQYNWTNGAACFYQALGTLNGQVKAPSKGQAAWPWLSPASTAGISCARCHDNGALIRSPYITQPMGSNTMPGAGDFAFNRDQLYYWVGNDFATWRASKVQVTGNLCNSCHRMGVSNLSGGGQGTSLDFGIRATDMSEPAKNPHSPDSPIWMTPGQITFSQVNSDFAHTIHDCALASAQGNPLPADCTVTPYAWAFLADLSLNGTPSSDPVQAGSQLTYTIQVTNNQAPGNGPVDVIPANSSDPNSPGVTLTDTLPAGVTLVSVTPGQGSCTVAGDVITCQLGRLNSGVSSNVTVTVMVPASTADGTILTNSVGVTSIIPDPETVNNTIQINTTVVTAADLSVTKSAGVDPVIAGTDETYQIALTNNGPSDAQAVTLNEATPANTTFTSLAAPAGWTCSTPPVGGTGVVNCTVPTLSSGASAAFSMAVHVSPAAPDGSTLTNTASVASSTNDPDPANNAVTIMTGVIARADLVLVKQAMADPVIAGTDETYQITLTNNGPSDAQSLLLTDTTPAGTAFASLAAESGWSCLTPAPGDAGTASCTVNTLAAGASASFSMVVHVSPSQPDGSTISNTASVSSMTTDLDPANNTATVTTGVIARADMRVTLSQASDLLIAGLQERYDLSVQNDGPSDAQNILLTDFLPSNTSFLSFNQMSGPAFTCTTPSGGSINCGLTTLSPGGSAGFALVVVVDPVDVNSITHRVSATSSITDPDPGNNSAEVTAVVSVKKYKQQVLTELTALRGSISDKQVGKKLDDAIQRLSASLSTGLWRSENSLNGKTGRNVFLREKDAIVKLSGLMGKNSLGLDGALQEMIERLVAADRALADIAIHQAGAAGGTSSQIVNAQKELERGNLSASSGQYPAAINHYRTAWQQAQLAMKK